MGALCRCVSVSPLSLNPLYSLLFQGQVGRAEGCGVLSQDTGSAATRDADLHIAERWAAHAEKAAVAMHMRLYPFRACGHAACPSLELQKAYLWARTWKRTLCWSAG